MNTLLDRISELARLENISIGALEKKIGASKGVLSRAIQNKTDIQAKWLIEIVENYPHYSANWLLTGKGEMFINPPAHALIEEKDELPLVPRELLSHIRSPKFSREQVEHYYNIRELNRRSDFLVEAKGDYMSPKYSGGDLIACRYIKDLLFFQWGRIYFISTRSQGEFIRRIQPSKDNDRIQCCSENPKYPPFDLPKSDIISIAIVKGAVSFE